MSSQSDATPPETSVTTVDWEAFYRDYRKPGFVPGFEITSKLGGGMFGLVFRARKQSIGRDYAIKFLKVDDDAVRRAVLAELEAVRHFAQVDHPNLVSIEDRGEVVGIPYIVMAYAGDRTLQGVLDAGASVDEKLPYLLQACRGVQALHEHSLVHFDLKPANVFLRGNVARVGDYGLSKLVAQSRNTLSMGRGTPYYMAPEMLRSKGDARSDIYSIGVMLYECLVGDLPFKGDSEWEVLRQHETAEPELPATLDSRQRRVLLRAMAKDPADRYPSVRDLLVDLVGDASSAGLVTPVPPPRADRAPAASAPAAGGDARRGLSDAAQAIADRTKDLVREAATTGKAAAGGAEVTYDKLKTAAGAFSREVKTAAGDLGGIARDAAREVTRDPRMRKAWRAYGPQGTAYEGLRERHASRRVVRAERRAERRARRRAMRARGRSALLTVTVLFVGFGLFSKLSSVRRSEGALGATPVSAAPAPYPVGVPAPASAELASGVGGAMAFAFDPQVEAVYRSASSMMASQMPMTLVLGQLGRSGEAGVVVAVQLLDELSQRAGVTPEDVRVVQLERFVGSAVEGVPGIGVDVHDRANRVLLRISRRRTSASARSR